MHALAVVAAFVFVGAPAASVSPTTGFELARSGGNIRPFTLSIDTAGAVHTTGAAPAHRRRLTKPQLAAINRAAFVDRFQALQLVTDCHGTLPDVATESIRVGGRTVRVHGTCVPGFNRLWAGLSRAVSP